MMDTFSAADEAVPFDLPGFSGLRRSCHFCRTHKIRCSGHPTCEACRGRNIECIYANEPSSSGRQTSKAPTKSPRTEMLSGYASPGPSLSSAVTSPSGASGGQRLLSEELENVSHRTILPGQAAPWTGLKRSAYWNSAATREPVHTGVKLPYREVFVGLAQAIVELFLMRYNSLGCSPREQTALADLGKLFFQHQGPLSFGARAPPIPQQSFSDLKVQQLIEVWFAHHPLSFILSKTLLLHTYTNGAHDHELLALVLAEASFFLGNEDISVSQAILEAARARVLERSTVSLSTLQALVLLGWHDVCLHRPRQGFCYLELARIMAAQRLGATTQASPAERHINGVNIHAVETELSQRTYWFTSSFALWIALHTESPDLDPLSPLDTTPLPAPDLSSASVVYSLDENFGTVASLVAQRTGVRELWSLSHITSTLGPILSLHLHNTTTSSTSPYWTAPTPPLSTPSPRALLADALANRLPPTLDHSNPTHTSLLAIYHLLAIHLAFPAQPATSPPVSAIIPSIQTFLSATQTLHRQAALQDLFGARDHDGRTAPLLVLGLDTCARALVRCGAEEEEESVAALAGRLWEVAGHRKLRLEPGLPAVRERVARLVAGGGQREVLAAQGGWQVLGGMGWAGEGGGFGEVDEVQREGAKGEGGEFGGMGDAGAGAGASDGLFGEWNLGLF